MHSGSRETAAHGERERNGCLLKVSMGCTGVSMVFHREYGVTLRPLQQEATAQFCPLHVFPPDVHVIITKAL